MASRLTFMSIILWGSVIIVTQVCTTSDEDEDEDENEDYSEEIMLYHFGSNSSYQERQWNITRGSALIKDGYTENCLLEVSSKKLNWVSKGPLCKLCSQVIAVKFPPEEPIKLRYAAFLHGILSFPRTKEEMLIDVVICSYDPRIGIDRIYITKGKDDYSVYEVKNVGVQATTEVEDRKDMKYKFNLEEYIIYDNKSMKEQ